MREPYTYKTKSAPLLGFPTFNILFEETVIREVSIPLNAMEELIKLLNQVYQNGYMEGKAGI